MALYTNLVALAVTGLTAAEVSEKGFLHEYFILTI